MKIGFLGPEGTFSEEAGLLYSKKLEGKGDLYPYATIHDVLYAADKKKIKEAIVPIENSIEGTIGVVTDMLVKDVNLVICQELVLPIFHYLIAPKGTKLSEITDVISNPPVLDQCRDFLRKKLPKARIHLSNSTADAVRKVALSMGEKINPKFAAIGTAASAKLYGLKIIVPKINLKDNQTRFVVLAKKDHQPTGKDKTSIVFSIQKDRPGGLHDILEVFDKRNINLTKIESRPAKKSLGEYYFFVDMAGHRQDKSLAEALKKVKQKASFFKLLGSYPKRVK